MFYQLRSICSTQLMRTIYYALINSKIEYGISVWEGTYVTTLKPLIVLQKSFVRHVAKCQKYAHTDLLFKDLRILHILNLYSYKVLKVYFNRSNTERRTIRNIEIVLRHHNNGPVPRPKLTTFKNFYTYTAPKMFNDLHQELKEIDCKSKFLQRLKLYLINCRTTPQ